MERDKDPFEGIITPVGLTPPYSDSASNEQEEIDPFAVDLACNKLKEIDTFESALTSSGMAASNSDELWKISAVFSEAQSKEEDASIRIVPEPIDMLHSSINIDENSNEAEDISEIEDLKKEESITLFDLILEAIMETNNRCSTKGFCTLEEIHDYISKLHLPYLSISWKKEVLDILHEKSTEFIHIPCVDKSFQDGSWTVHPYTAKNHKRIKRSTLNNHNRSSAANPPKSPKIPDCLKNINLCPVVRIARSSYIESLLCLYIKKTMLQANMQINFTKSENLPWNGWTEPCAALVEKS